jgi:hypothetical protein
MGVHDEILIERKKRGWPPGQEKAKCSVPSCHKPEKARGKCAYHLGNPVARSLKEQVRRRGLAPLRKLR